MSYIYNVVLLSYTYIWIETNENNSRRISLMLNQVGTDHCIRIDAVYMDGHSPWYDIEIFSLRWQMRKERKEHIAIA